MRQYNPSKSTTVIIEPTALTFDNEYGNHLELVLQADGKLQIDLNGKGVRMSADEVQLIRTLLK